MSSKMKLKEILVYGTEKKRVKMGDWFRGLLAAVPWALLLAALSLLSLLFVLIVHNILEAIYGARTLYLMSNDNPVVDRLLYGLWSPIFHILILLVLSMPLWKDHPVEKTRASIFFSATLLLYILWGFVLGEFESQILLDFGVFLRFFIPSFHAILALNIRQMKGA